MLSLAVEPMTSPHIFHDVSQIFLSPQIGAVTSDSYINMGVGGAKNVLNALSKAVQAITD